MAENHISKIKRSNKTLSSIAKDKILEYIKSNDLNKEDKIPSENKFSKMLGVSRVTIRTALSQLESENIIKKEQGKGSFVNIKPFKIENGLEVFETPSEILKRNGYKIDDNLFNMEIVQPSKEQINKLNLDQNEKVVTYYRQRYLKNNLIVYSKTTLSINNFKNNEAPKKIKNESMLHFFEDILNIKIRRSRSEIIPVILSSKKNQYLDLEEDTLFLLLKQVLINSNDEPIIFSLDYFNKSHFKFFINRNRLN